MTPHPPIRTDIVTLERVLEDGGSWRALAGDAVVENLFAGPDMLAAAAGTIERAAWQVVRAFRGERLIGLAVARVARPLGPLGPAVADGFWSHYGPRGTPLIRRGEPEAAGALIAAMAGLAPVVRLLFQGMDDPVSRLLGEALAARGIRPIWLDVHERAVLDAGAPFDAAAGPGLSGKRLREMERQWRKLTGGDGAAHEVATAPGDVERALGAFLDIERSGWKGRRGTSLADAPERTAFARSFIGALSRDGRVRADVIRREGAVIAVLISLVARDRAAIWKIAHLEAYAPASPGAQLIRLATAGFIADPAIAEVDSLAAPGHPMIERLWAGRMRVGTLIFAADPAKASAAERVAALHAGVQRLRSAVKSLKSRIAR